MSTHKLSELGLSELIAPKGKFRSVALIDSAPYQIGDDSDTLVEAEQKCIDAYKPLSSFHVYDDTGQQQPMKGFDYHIALKEALAAQAKVVAFEESLRGATQVRDAQRTAVREILKPHIQQALQEFQTEYGIRISLENSGITPHEKGVDLDVRLFDGATSVDGEFDEEFDNREDLEVSVTKALRVILEKIFRENGLPLTLGEITVPNHYFTL